jgi:hypothetical protein
MTPFYVKRREVKREAGRERPTHILFDARSENSAVKTNRLVPYREVSKRADSCPPEWRSGTAGVDVELPLQIATANGACGQVSGRCL